MILISPTLLAQVNMGLGLQGCYPFHGNANDNSGNGHNGLVIGAQLTQDRNGAANSAYAFNGTDQHIDVVDFNTFGITDEVSIGFWVRDLGSYGNFAVALWPDDFYDRLECSPNYNHNGVNTVFWDFGDATNGGRTFIQPYDFAAAWQHYIFTSSAASDRMRIYHDGALLLEENHHSSLVDAQRILGFGGGGDQAYMYLNGDLDDVVIYDRELNGEEAQYLFEHGVACGSAIASVPSLAPVAPSIHFDPANRLLLVHAENAVRLDIVDASGRSVLAQHLASGDHQVPVRVSSGVYLAVATSASARSTIRLYVP